MKADQRELKIELRGETEVVMTRYFAAPRQLVYDCHTKPELMQKWLIGPPDTVLSIAKNDVRTGGKYLYVYTSKDGGKMGVFGTFLDVVAPGKISNSENYAMDLSIFAPNAPEDPNATVETRTFTEEGEFTLLTHVSKYASAEIRKMMLESGATEGWAPCYAELDKLLAKGK